VKRTAEDDGLLTASEIATGILGETARMSRIGRAEALRRAMPATMETEGKDYFARPMFSAPFAVVGEGGWRIATHARDHASERMPVPEHLR